MKLKAVTLTMMSAGLLLATATTQAAQSSDVTYTFGGFGTLSAVHNNNRDFDFRGSIIQPNGVGLTRSTSYGIDSKLGVQGTAQINKDLSATVQAVADRRANNNYSPRFEWANLKYQINNDLYVRAGRVVAPVFMVSDYRNVGYAQTMVRMPYEAYGQNPISHLDGGEINYTLAIGPGLLTTGITAGRVKELPPDGEVKGSGKLLNFSYEVGSSTFRLGYLKTHVNVSGGTVATSEMVTAAGPLVGHPDPTLVFKNMNTRLLDLGYLFDNGTWIAQTEYIQTRANVRTVKETNVWYAMGGYRLGNFTPYVSYAQVKDKSDALNQPLATVTPACIAVMGAANCAGLAYGNNAIDARTRTRMEQKTFSVGVRYDVMKNIALKFQFDHIRKPGSAAEPSTGMLMSAAPTFPALYEPGVLNKASLNLTTLSIDFVF